ncbi:MAG: iron-sulfur cluster assembly scaffold protein [Desulfovibrionaceae bacterium]
MQTKTDPVPHGRDHEHGRGRPLPAEALEKLFPGGLPHLGEIANASCRGKVRGSCGDAIEISLRIHGEQVLDAGFQTDGCISSAVCASACCGLAVGKSLEDAASLDDAAILASLDMEAVPDGEEHCAHVAAKALEAAIHHWMQRGG